MYRIFAQRLFLFMRKKWWIFGINIIICLFVFTHIAGLKIEDNKIVREQGILEKQVFEENLQIYDLAIQDLESGISNLRTVIDTTQNYLDNSVYMNLDSQNICVSTVHYVVEGNDYSKVISNLSAYVNDGSIISNMLEYDEEISGEYLQEIIYCTSNSNTFVVAVMHYDQQQANYLMELVDACIMQHLPQVKYVLGEFEMQQVDSASYIKADAAILTAQNNQLNSLKGHQSSMSDLEQKLANEYVLRNQYVMENQPYYATTSNKTILAVHVLAGIIAGVIVTLVLWILYYILNNKIYNEKEMQSLKLNVLDTFGLGGADQNLFIIDLLQEIKEKSGNSQFYFSVIGSRQTLDILNEKYLPMITCEEFKIVTGYDVMNNAKDLKEMIRVGNCVLIVKAGENSYSDIRDHIELCSKFDIPIWGSIFIKD